MGVGRTGVFIALSIALERMRYEGVVDMFQTVRMLRTQRPAMVQTEVCITLWNELLFYNPPSCSFDTHSGCLQAMSDQVANLLYTEANSVCVLPSVGWQSSLWAMGWRRSVTLRVFAVSLDKVKNSLLPGFNKLLVLLSV